MNVKFFHLLSALEFLAEAGILPDESRTLYEKLSALIESGALSSYDTIYESC